MEHVIFAYAVPISKYQDFGVYAWFMFRTYHIYSTQVFTIDLNISQYIRVKCNVLFDNVVANIQLFIFINNFSKLTISMEYLIERQIANIFINRKYYYMPKAVFLYVCRQMSFTEDTFFIAQGYLSTIYKSKNYSHEFSILARNLLQNQRQGFIKFHMPILQELSYHNKVSKYI